MRQCWNSMFYVWLFVCFPWKIFLWRGTALNWCTQMNFWHKHFCIFHQFSSMNLKQTGEETFFKIKKTTKMSKVFSTYAQRKGVQVGSLRFLLDGERIKEGDTPKTLELEENDQVDCMLEQVGGCWINRLFFARERVFVCQYYKMKYYILDNPRGTNTSRYSQLMDHDLIKNNDIVIYI